MSTSPVSAQLPRPGDVIAGKYLLDHLLGQGGMGAVFAAKHIKLSKAVAIKIMLADTSNPEAAQRFINEGRAAANIQNEHVVRVDDVDEEMGYAYMVLELLDGEDLSQILERELTHRLPPHVAVGYVLQALAGVMQAHAIGIVHRDLKPSNLFLARRKDGSVVVKVLDFGISKAQGSSALAASPSALTSTKAMLGSPLYMSPEQLRSSKSVDHRADIWAMGVILYELITGTLPFMGDNLGELFAAILETDPPPLSSRADVPPGLEAVVQRCLQRKPDHRFQTVVELTHALTPFAAAMNRTSQPALGVAMLGPRALGSSGMARPGEITAAGPPTGPGGALASGTVALGAVTPQGGMIQTGSGGWQSTGNGRNVVPTRSNTPLLIAAVVGAVVLLLGVVGGGAYWKSHKKGQEDPTLAASSVPSSVPSAAVVAPPPASFAVVEPAPAPEVSVAATSSATPAPTPTGGAAATVVVKRTPTPPKNGAGGDPPAGKTADPAPTHKPKPTPAPTATDNLVNTR